MWSETQKYRLALEYKLLEKKMPQFKWYDLEGNTYLEGQVRTNDDGREYVLQCVLSNKFPDQKPKLFVVSPHTLPKYDGRGTINGAGKSHSFHTLDNGPRGCVQICHFKSEWWDSTKTLMAVLMKGMYWLEAYSTHLQTGKPIAVYCS